MSKANHNLFQIAQVLKSNNADGEIVISCRDLSPEDINLKEPVFIYFDGLPVPFYIESLILRGNTKALVHLTDIETCEDAEEIAGKGIFADKSSYPDDYEEDDDLSAIIGWELHSANHIEGISDSCNSEYIGTITDFLDIPHNPCIEVETKKGAVTIPLHEDLIHTVNPESRTIFMEIPDGLMSL